MRGLAGFRITGFGLRAGLALVLITLAVNQSWGYVTAKIRSATNVITNQKWASMPITWRMNPTVGPNVTGSRSQVDVLRDSFAAWSGISSASIAFTQGADTAESVGKGFDGINLISSNLTPAEYASGALGLTLVYSFDSGGGVDTFGRPVQFAGQIMEADILFNPETSFSTETSAVQGRIDFQSVATHEIGHLLGLDHTSMVSATMFPTIADGINYSKDLSTDEVAGVSTLYPAPSFATKGKISGVVRTIANVAVYGAIVTALNGNGQPVASALTDPSGQYLIEGLDPGTYTVYAEPLDRPLQIGNVSTLTRIYPGATVNAGFTTRFR